MARQVAALPKKKFELYRSKKILTSGDHPLFAAGTNQVLKDKFCTNSINITAAFSSIEKDLVSIPQYQVDVLDSVEVINSETKPKNGNKKKRKSKKGKSATSSSSQDQSVTNTSTGEQDGINLDLKHKVLSLESCSSLCVKMNSNLETDNSAGRKLKTVQNLQSNGTDSRCCGSSSSNDSGIVTPDSGLGSYTSPVFTKQPPFGFPPSSQKLLESALGLLPSVALKKDNSSSFLGSSENTKDPFHSSEDSSSKQKEGAQSSDNIRASKTDKTDMPKQEIVHKNSDIEDDPISDISDTKEVCKDFVVIEGDSVDGDVSSSSAVEEEGGWQSQTRRSHRKKKRELAARASRERNHMDRFQRKDFHKQQSDNQFRKNHYRRRSVDDKKNVVKTEKKFQDNENKSSTVLVESPIMNSNMDGQMQAKTDKDVGSKVSKGPLTSDNKLTSQTEVPPTPKRLSYRDVLLKARGKAERTESSDSGVDANSVSSCELSNLQQESPRDLFNKQQCVNYLQNAWKKVMSNAKQGLVIYFSVDSDPVLCEQKRKKRAGSDVSSKQK